LFRQDCITCRYLASHLRAKLTRACSAASLVGEEILTRDWNSKQEIVKGRSQEARTINHYIEDVRFRIKEKYLMLEDSNHSVLDIVKVIKKTLTFALVL
jgi:hypothetical protein